MKNFRMTRAVCALLAAAALGAGVAGCVPLVIGGAAIGGMMAGDRRTAGTQVEDEGIELRAVNRINADYGERVHINVTSFNRQVLLTGEVPTAQIRQAVEHSVADVGNVLSVVNDLGVQPNSSLGQRSTDTFITGKVRAGLVDAKDISASPFKVVTERNVVYLMGLVTEREAARAASIARGVDGVRKVVRTLEILTEEQLVRLTTVQLAPVSTDTAQPVRQSPVQPAHSAQSMQPAPVESAPSSPVQVQQVEMQQLPPLVPLLSL